MQNLQILPSIPNEFSPSVPTSSSDFVVSRRMREYVSDGQTDYTYDGNNVIKFTLNSADAFLDGRNSWLQFKLWSEITANGETDTDNERLARFLDSGGAHALFSRLRISLSNGTIISDYDYAQLYAMIRQHTMSFQHLEYQEANSSYDGAAADVYNYCGIASVKKHNQNLYGTEPDVDDITIAATAVSAAQQTGYLLTLAAIPAGLQGQVELGDEIQLVSNNSLNDVASIIYGKVIQIPSAASFVIEVNPSTDAANTLSPITSTNLTTLVKVYRGDRSPRYRGAQGTSDATGILCKVKLFSDFFNNVKYLPLPFLRNLTIELTLARPHHCISFLRKGGNPAAAPGEAGVGDAFAMKMHVSNPVIVANLVTPSESLMNAYVDQYNSEQGIMLHWIDYQSNRISRNNRAQNDTLIIPSNCHSALAVLVAQKLAESQTANVDSFANDTTGNNVKGYISTYQFQIGSEYFPFSRPVDCGGGVDGDANNITNGNAWNYVLQALDSHGAKYECSSIVPNEYYAVNTLYRPKGGAISDESLRFVMAARLDRDGNYTGIDTSNNDIQLNLTRHTALVAAYDGYYYHAFIVHNRLMRISKASSIVFS